MPLYLVVTQVVPLERFQPLHNVLFRQLRMRGFFLKDADLQFIALGFQRCQTLFCCLGDDALFYRGGNIVNFLIDLF